MPLLHQKRGPSIIWALKISVSEGRCTTTERYFHEKANRWDNRAIDLSNYFAAIFDLSNMRVGNYRFVTGKSVDISNEVRPDQALPEAPAGYTDGLRLLVKLACYPHTVCELLATSAALYDALARLYNTFEAGLAEAPDLRGLLPLVKIEKWDGVPVKGGTALVPKFKIDSWDKRPADLLDLPPPKPQQRRAASANNGSCRSEAPPARLIELPPLEDHGDNPADEDIDILF